MRLIHCATGRIESSWPEGVAPPYAILSHTWAQPQDGHAAEVGYEDYLAGREASPSLGWDKVDAAVRAASRDGLEYIWIDSCCIDKTSSAELSEAINSMFEWYSAAAVCYTHLADYEAKDDDDDDAKLPGYDSKAGKLPDRDGKGGEKLPSYDGSGSGRGAKLAACRWFYRGWTLQELIAPTRLEFYDARWRHVGSRSSLCDDVAAITGVDRELLLSDSRDQTARLLRQATIARRFSWAAKRATTRAEDLAYCLLGLFEVNMPLLYGEGPRAFVRLQKEIMRDSDDMTIFAWQAAPGYKKQVSEFRGILARTADEFSLPSEVVSTHDAGFNPSFEVTNKGLRIDVPLKATSNGEVMWMSLNCRSSDDKAPLGILLRYQGANRFIRSNPHSLEPEPAAGEWTRPGQVFIALDAAVPVTAIVPPNAVHQNSFAFGLDAYRLQMVRVSHPDRWYSPNSTLNTYGDPNFTGAYIFRTRMTDTLPETDLILAFGVNGPGGEPWACLGICDGRRKARAGNVGKVDMGTDLYDAAVLEKWDTVRQLGMAAGTRGIRVYARRELKWGLFVSAGRPEPASKDGLYNVAIACEPFSDSSFAPGLKGALKPKQ